MYKNGCPVETCALGECALDHVLRCTACRIDRKRVVVKAGRVNLCGVLTPWVLLDSVRSSSVVESS